jgi:hypothetical protein
MDDPAMMLEWEKTARIYVDDPKNSEMFAELAARLIATGSPV